MRAFKNLVTVIGPAVLACTTTFARGADGLTPAEFERLHGELTSAREPWQTLPWKLSLVEARAQAAKERKPIYMLCRAGHPLGCV